MDSLSDAMLLILRVAIRTSSRRKDPAREIESARPHVLPQKRSMIGTRAGWIIARSGARAVPSHRPVLQRCTHLSVRCGDGVRASTHFAFERLPRFE